MRLLIRVHLPWLKNIKTGPFKGTCTYNWSLAHLHLEAHAPIYAGIRYIIYKCPKLFHRVTLCAQCRLELRLWVIEVSWIMEWLQFVQVRHVVVSHWLVIVHRCLPMCGFGGIFHKAQWRVASWDLRFRPMLSIAGTVPDCYRINSLG